MIDKPDLNTKALKLRKLLGADDHSPIDIFSLALKLKDLTLVFYPLGEKISGICVRDADVRLIAVNSAMSLGRVRFSLAHELYHLFCEEGPGSYVCSGKFESDNENEKRADQFASYFLAPFRSLKSSVEKILNNGTGAKRKRTGAKLTLHEVIALEQHYKMSHQAMLVRLVSENYLDHGDPEEYSRGVIFEARILGLDDSLYQPLPAEMREKTFGYYLKQVEALRDNDLVSQGKIEELLLDAFRDDIVFGSGEKGDAID